MGSLSCSHPGDLLFQFHPCGRWHKVRCCFPGDFPARFHCSGSGGSSGNIMRKKIREVLQVRRRQEG